MHTSLSRHFSFADMQHQVALLSRAKYIHAG
jgi:hypothetical protein